MNLTIIAVGRAKAGPERALFDHYRKRLPWTFDLIEVEERRRLDGRALQESEGALLLAKVPKGAKIVVLDERGSIPSSADFAEMLGHWRDDGLASVSFLIGGADGHTDAVRKKADKVLSLGKLTWPHMLVRGMLAEQVYRSWSILHNHPYHRAGQ